VTIVFPAYALTLSVHITDLIRDGLLERNDNREYVTSKQGNENLKLMPYVRISPEGKTSKEFVRMIQIGLKPIPLTFKENLKFELGGMIGVTHDKTLKKIYEDIAKTIQQSVTLWLPKDLEPDKAMYREVNRLIGLHIKQNSELINKKLTILIEFDLNKALDFVIREETDEDVKERLKKNRQKILSKIYKQWKRLTK